MQIVLVIGKVSLLASPTYSVSVKVIDKERSGLTIVSVDPLNFFAMKDAGKDLMGGYSFEKIVKSKKALEADYGIKLKDDEVVLATSNKDTDESSMTVEEKKMSEKVVCWAAYGCHPDPKKDGNYYFFFTDNRLLKTREEKSSPYVQGAEFRKTNRDGEQTPFGEIYRLKELEVYLNNIKQDVKRYVNRVAQNKWQVVNGIVEDPEDLRNPKTNYRWLALHGGSGI